MIDHTIDREAVMAGSNEPPVPTGSDIWQLISDGIERDGDRAARSHLAAGFPIYLSDDGTLSGTVIRKNPDGTRQLVHFDADGEHVVAPLPAVEPRI
jgi:hypothetical protein